MMDSNQHKQMPQLTITIPTGSGPCTSSSDMPKIMPIIYHEIAHPKLLPVRVVQFGHTMFSCVLTVKVDDEGVHLYSDTTVPPFVKTQIHKCCRSWHEDSSARRKAHVITRIEPFQNSYPYIL